MSSATPNGFVKDAWQTPRNARTLRAFMALQNQDIADRLKELRKAKGNPPQTDVAEAIGAAERTFQSWEQADAKPSYRFLQRLAAYYGVGEDFILTGVDRGETPNPFKLSDQVDDVRLEFREDVTEIKARLESVERELATAREDRVTLKAEIREQNELLVGQSELLEEIRRERVDLTQAIERALNETIDRIGGLVMNLPTDETTRRLEQALRGEDQPPEQSETGI